MDLYEVIDNRRTIRVFNEGATEGQLNKIILAGTKAPSAVNRQPWEFIIIDSQDIIDQLSDIKYKQTRNNPPDKVKGDLKAIEKLAQAQKDSFRNSSIVAVCHLVDWERSVWMCLENISLAAVAEGLGTGIVLFWGEGQKEAGKVLGLPEEYQLTAILKIGVPAEAGYPRDENPYAPRRPEFSWIHKDRF
ncbi:nitroreductase family protein [Thermodesulfobacteriota bacterium]